MVLGDDYKMSKFEEVLRSYIDRIKALNFGGAEITEQHLQRNEQARNAVLARDSAEVLSSFIDPNIVASRANMATHSRHFASLIDIGNTLYHPSINEAENCDADGKARYNFFRRNTQTPLLKSEVDYSDQDKLPRNIVALRLIQGIAEEMHKMENMQGADLVEAFSAIIPEHVQELLDWEMLTVEQLNIHREFAHVLLRSPELSALVLGNQATFDELRNIHAHSPRKLSYIAGDSDIRALIDQGHATATEVCELCTESMPKLRMLATRNSRTLMNALGMNCMEVNALSGEGWRVFGALSRNNNAMRLIESGGEEMLNTLIDCYLNDRDRFEALVGDDVLERVGENPEFLTSDHNASLSTEDEYLDIEEATARIADLNVISVDELIRMQEEAPEVLEVLANRNIIAMIEAGYVEFSRLRELPIDELQFLADDNVYALMKDHGLRFDALRSMRDFSPEFTKCIASPKVRKMMGRFGVTPNVLLNEYYPIIARARLRGTSKDVTQIALLCNENFMSLIVAGIFDESEQIMIDHSEALGFMCDENASRLLLDGHMTLQQFAEMAYKNPEKLSALSSDDAMRIMYRHGVSIDMLDALYEGERGLFEQIHNEDFQNLTTDEFWSMIHDAFPEEDLVRVMRENPRYGIFAEDGVAEDRELNVSQASGAGSRRSSVSSQASDAGIDPEDIEGAVADDRDYGDRDYDDAPSSSMSDAESEQHSKRTQER